MPDFLLRNIKGGKNEVIDSFDLFRECTISVSSILFKAKVDVCVIRCLGGAPSLEPSAFCVANAIFGLLMNNNNNNLFTESLISVTFFHVKAG